MSESEKRAHRIVELGSSVAAAYCTRLLGMHGADVVKVEPPGGDKMRRSEPRFTDPEGKVRSGTFEYLNCYKRSMVLDEESSADKAVLAELIASADAVVEAVDGEPDTTTRRFAGGIGRNPALVYAALSSFGLTGPYAHYRSNDFLDFASGGHSFITGDPDREPVQGGGPYSGYATGSMGAFGVLAALRSARRTGQGQLVDIGAMEVMVSIHQWTVTLYTHQGVIKQRAANRHAESHHPMGPFPCRDGWVCIGASMPAQWEGTCLAIDMPELLADDRFATNGDRFDHADELDALILPRLEELDRRELLEKLHEFRVPAGEVLSLGAVLADEQLAARDFWSPLGDRGQVPTNPYRLVPGDPPFSAAPALDGDGLQIRDELDIRKED